MMCLCENSEKKKTLVFLRKVLGGATFLCGKCYDTGQPWLVQIVSMRPLAIKKGTLGCENYIFSYYRIHDSEGEDGLTHDFFLFVLICNYQDKSASD